MVCCGYLMNRVADLLNRTRTAWMVSLFVVHIAFGLATLTEGLTGNNGRGPVGTIVASDLSAHGAQPVRADHSTESATRLISCSFSSASTRHVGPQLCEVGCHYSSGSSASFTTSTTRLLIEKTNF